MKTTLTLAVAAILLAASLATAAEGSKANRISISYEPPTNPEHRQIYMDLEERGSLERLQEFLKPFRLPQRLTIRMAGCDGEADAFYDDGHGNDHSITICYEYVDALWKNAPAETTPAGIAPIDTVIGPFVDTSLHEFAHALFAMLELPVFGREEDAADRVAAYIYLQLGYEESRRLITGTAYTYFNEALAAGELSLEEFAGEHGTPAQRAYTLLCMAYGADTKLFGDFVSEGYLPEERAESCEEEYEQIQDAYETAVFPHLDKALAKETFKRTWLRGSAEQKN